MNTVGKTKEASQRTPVKAKLKWFNAAKGFGFVVPEDNPVDAFLHITQLQRLGIHGLGEGAVVLCDVDYGEKGANVLEVVQVLEHGHVPDGATTQDQKDPSLFWVKGIVKYYRPDKGFGFISPFDGMKDIFIHKSCLQNCGVAELNAGQQVRVAFKSAQKGREAISVEIETTP